jgi:phosphopantetheinyl transferase (holo-ACP synthase)
MVAMLGGEIVSHLTIVHTKQVAIACVVLERHRTGTPLSWEKEWK